MCWFEKNKKLYFKECETINNNFPKLKFYRSNDSLLIKGKIDLSNGEDILDSYQIAIIFPDNYPIGVPELLEIGGRIPRIADRHVNSKTGFCCIGPRLEQRQLWLKESTISAYITRFVVPFLANQSYYERMGEWRNGQYDHGAKGVGRYYAESFDLTDRHVLELVLNNLAMNQKLGRNDSCLCGSGKKAKKCHLDLFNKLRSNGYPELFNKDLEDFKKDTKAQNEIPLGFEI